MLLAPPPSLESTAPPTPAHRPDKVFVDRRENLMIFGIKESQSMTDTMDSVKKMLEFLTGRSTTVKDLFRIGKFMEPRVSHDEPSPSRPRPIVLKLTSPWDRRLVLANRFNLKEYTVKGIFVREDLFFYVTNLVLPLS